MIVPDVISSDSCDFNDNMSQISMNDRYENATIATYTPTVVNPYKRRRLMREPTLTEEDSKASEGGWGTKVGIKESPTSPAMATTSTVASFGVPIASFNDSEPPQKDQSNVSLEEVSIELCKIVATPQYSRSEAVKALGNFCTWGYTDDVVFLEDFLELGGIQRVLMYLQNNQGDPLCVAMASKVIMACTFRTPSQKSYAPANEIVRALSKRDGIQFLLNACNEYEGENMASQLEALRWIWAALMNISDKSAAYESTDPNEIKNQLLSVFESGLEAMYKLGKNASLVGDAPTEIPSLDASKNADNSDTRNSMYKNGQLERYNAVGGAEYQLKAVQWVFSTLCGGGGSRKRAAMDMIVTNRQPTITRKKVPARAIVPRKAGATDNSKTASMIMGIIFSAWLNIVQNSKLVRDDFLGIELLHKSISILKSPDNGKWIRNKNLLIQASKFFVQCREKDILSTSEDFEVVFPLIVKCIGMYPEASFEAGLFDFVKDAYSILERSFLQGSGVVRAIATAWESESVEKATKDASHKLLKELL